MLTHVKRKSLVHGCVTFNRSPLLSETELPQLFRNRNSHSQLQLGAQTESFIRRLSAKSGACMGVFGRKAKAHQNTFVWREICLPFWLGGNGEGRGGCCQRQSRLMKLRGYVSQKEIGHCRLFWLPPAEHQIFCLFAPVAHVLTWLWVKLQQLGPGKWPWHPVDPLSIFCLFSLNSSLDTYWVLTICWFSGVSAVNKIDQALTLKDLSVL
jgi:hypothetical protein